MEPVFMELGQSCAIAAAMAIDRRVPVQEVDASAIRNELVRDPLADGSTPEILVDNDDSASVRVEGEWVREKHDSYGFSRLVAGSSSGEVKFGFSVADAGMYALYVYVPKIQGASAVTGVSVVTGGKRVDAAVPTGKLQVEGQTSGEWVECGKYKLEKGEGYVGISNKGADGKVVADAVLLVRGK